MHHFAVATLLDDLVAALRLGDGETFAGEVDAPAPSASVERDAREDRAAAALAFRLRRAQFGAEYDALTRRADGLLR